jgi:hypothetical protein
LLNTAATSGPFALSIRATNLSKSVAANEPGKRRAETDQEARVATHKAMPNATDKGRTTPLSIAQPNPGADDRSPSQDKGA